MQGGGGPAPRGVLEAPQPPGGRHALRQTGAGGKGAGELWGFAMEIHINDLI